MNGFPPKVSDGAVRWPEKLFSFFAFEIPNISDLEKREKHEVLSRFSHKILEKTNLAIPSENGKDRGPGARWRISSICQKTDSGAPAHTHNDSWWIIHSIPRPRGWVVIFRDNTRGHPLTIPKRLNVVEVTALPFDERLSIVQVLAETEGHLMKCLSPVRTRYCKGLTLIKPN